MKPYRIIEHTADIGLEVRGKTKEELFINAAEGMFSLILPEGRSPAHPVPKHITFNGTDNETLLVSFLQELLYMCTGKSFIPCTYKKISFKKDTGSADIRAVFIDRNKITFKTEIKAVTYHEMHITRTDDFFHTKIIFDV